MNIFDHMMKFERAESALADIDPHGSFEIWLWSAQNGLTHLYNAALHCAGLTREDETFPSQVLGVHYTPSGSNGALERVLVGDADVLHTNMPELKVTLPPHIDEARAALEVIEGLSIKYGRTECPHSDEDVETALAAFDACRRALKSAV